MRECYRQHEHEIINIIYQYIHDNARLHKCVTLSCNCNLRQPKTSDASLISLGFNNIRICDLFVPLQLCSEFNRLTALQVVGTD